MAEAAMVETVAKAAWVKAVGVMAGALSRYCSQPYYSKLKPRHPAALVRERGNNKKWTEPSPNWRPLLVCCLPMQAIRLQRCQ